MGWPHTYPPVLVLESEVKIIGPNTIEVIYGTEEKKEMDSEGD